VIGQNRHSKGAPQPEVGQALRLAWQCEDMQPVGGGR